MSLVAEIKCAKCDRKFSGVRSRCPFCGERLIGRGKSAEGADRFRLKMLLSVLIMGVLVIAAGALLFTTPIPAAAPPPQVHTPQTPNLPSDLDTNTLPGTHPETPPPEPTPPPEEPSPEPVPVVLNLIITYNGRENKDFTANVGERVDLKVIVVPDGIDEEVVWVSSNEAVFQVVALNTEGTAARVTGLGKGTATLTASAGDVEAECIVRIR